MFHGEIIIDEIGKNCIGCVHKVAGVCNLTKKVPEKRCEYFEETGKWYKTQTKGNV